MYKFLFGRCSEITFQWWLQNYEYTKNHKTEHFKWVYFMECELHLNKTTLKKINIVYHVSLELTTKTRKILMKDR
jgi:hypothetical protein